MRQPAVVQPSPAIRRPQPVAEVEEFAAAFDRELPLVEGAITLVASGVAPRVTLVGLGGGMSLARLAKSLGRHAGLVVVARRHGAAGRPHDRRIDLIVERDG